MPALAHSTAYIGLSSIRTLAPSSLQNGQIAAFTVKISDNDIVHWVLHHTKGAQEQVGTHLVQQGVQLTLWSRQTMDKDDMQGEILQAVAMQQAWTAECASNHALTQAVAMLAGWKSRLQISDFDLDLPSNAQWLPKWTSAKMPG